MKKVNPNAGGRESRWTGESSRTNRIGYGAGFFSGKEFLDDGEPEIESRAGAARRDEVSVDDNALLGKDMVQLIGDGKMSGVAVAGEDARVVQDRGGGTNRDEPATGVILGDDQRAYPRVGAEVLGAGATGEENAIELARGQCGERRIGVNCDAGAAGHVNGFAEGGGDDLGAGTAQQVDGGERFDLFKTFRQDCENGGHAMI